MSLFMKIKERWKYLLACYLIGYIISLFVTGIPNFTYIIPIKLSAIVFMILIGNAIYHASKGMPVYHYPIKCMKYFLVIIVAVLVFNLIRVVLLQCNIDITPLMGISKG